ncbi:hypothetical protein K6112_04520 [Methylophilales bacterium]|nr:hypothetical protein K6112_04520 [Methylophilales bacterium]
MITFNKKYYLLLAALIVILPHIYYGDGRILNAGDYAWSLDFNGYFNRGLSTWDDSYNFGNPVPRHHVTLLFGSIGYLLTQFDFSHATVQSIIFFVFTVICLLGTLQLGRLFSWKEEQSIVFSLLYIFSSISLHYWSPDHGMNIFVYQLLPATMALALKFLNTNNLLFLVGFFIICLNPGFSNPAFFICYFAVLLFFLVISGHILSNKNHITLSRKALVVFIFFIANCYWLFPFVADIANQHNSASNLIAGLVNDRKIAINDSYAILYSLLGNGGGLWTANGFHGPNMPIRIWGEFIRSNIFILFNILVVLISIFPLFTPKVDKKHVIFLGAYLFIVVLIAGMKYTFPINLIPELFLDIPGFERGFRSISMKVGLILAFFASIIMSYSVKTPFKVITFIFILLSTLPFLKGLNYSDNNGSKPPEYMMPPDEYDVLKKISQDANYDFPPSLVKLPINEKSYNIILKWNDEEGFVGSEFIRMYWDGPAIYFYDGNSGTRRIVDNCGGSVNLNCIKDMISRGNSFFLVKNDSLINRGDHNLVRSKLLDMEKLGILKTVEKNQHFYLFESVKEVDNSLHFLSINCHNDKEQSSAVRVNASLININSSCKNPDIIKYGNHQDSWWLCDGDKYQKNINNSNGLIKQKKDGMQKYISDIGCGIAHKTRDVILGTSKDKDKNKFIVYWPYITFIIGLGISISFLISILIFGIIQQTKGKNKK